MPNESLGRRLVATARLPATWQASALYAVVFGGYVASSVYLPTYLETGYGLASADAADWMAAGFVLLAVVMRPLVAFWPFSRLVHVFSMFSMPLGYLTRPYIVYRSRGPRLGDRRLRRGWERTT